MFEREVVVSNPNGSEGQLRQCFPFSAPGLHGCTVTLPPFSHREFQASRFHDRSVDAGRPSAVVLYLNGKETPCRLVPQDFLRYVKIVLHVEDEERGLITIKGIEANWTDLCRFRGFKFLGRKYEHRQERVIRQCYLA